MQVSDQIIKVLNDIGQKIGIAIDWTSQNVLPQVMDIMKRLIVLEIVKNWIGIAICVGFALFCFILIKKLTKGSWDYWDMPVVFSIMGIVLAIIVLIVLVFALAELYTVPEIWLFQYVKGLMS